MNQVYSRDLNLRGRNKLVVDARNQGAWMQLRGQSVLRKPWKRRIGHLKTPEQVDRNGPVLTPRTSIHYTARKSEVAKEVGQEDVEIASTETHPLEN